jgi:hypothetical protein|tara:strand:+ start:1364 stop:1675 length:312 start_codon:yes stop_codon:yes gene_type:complete
MAASLVKVGSPAILFKVALILSLQILGLCSFYGQPLPSAFGTLMYDIFIGIGNETDLFVSPDSFFGETESHLAFLDNPRATATIIQTENAYAPVQFEVASSRG